MICEWVLGVGVILSSIRLCTRGTTRAIPLRFSDGLDTLERGSATDHFPSITTPPNGTRSRREFGDSSDIMWKGNDLFPLFESPLAMGRFFVLCMFQLFS